MKSIWMIKFTGSFISVLGWEGVVGLEESCFGEYADVGHVFDVEGNFDCVTFESVVYVSDAVFERFVFDLNDEGVGYLLSVIDLVEYPVGDGHFAVEFGDWVGELDFDEDEELFEVPGVEGAEVGEHVVSEGCLLPVVGFDEVGQLGDFESDFGLGVVRQSAVGEVYCAHYGEYEACV